MPRAQCCVWDFSAYLLDGSKCISDEHAAAKGSKLTASMKQHLFTLISFHWTIKHVAVRHYLSPMAWVLVDWAGVGWGVALRSCQCRMSKRPGGSFRRIALTDKHSRALEFSERSLFPPQSRMGEVVMLGGQAQCSRTRWKTFAVRLLCSLFPQEPCIRVTHTAGAQRQTVLRRNRPESGGGLPGCSPQPQPSPRAVLI